MTKNYKHKKTLPYLLLAVVTLCFTFICSTLCSATPVFAYSETLSSISSSTNLSFSYNTTSSLYTNPTGWTKGLDKDDTTSGTINLTKLPDAYNLTSDQRPSKQSSESDDYALMINSKTSVSQSIPKSQYYTNSSSIELEAYSNYKIKVYTQVTDDAYASIYLTGLKDDLSFESITNTGKVWTDYSFYVQTGMDAQSVKLELWLGSKPSNGSIGAVFFDNIEITQISDDEVVTSGSRVKHINYNQSSIIDVINGDFETNNLNDWTKIHELAINSYAELINLTDASESDAKGITYVGTDLAKDNSRALVLYTTNNTKSYIGYKSKDLSLSMYDIIKITVNAKVADLDGSAYIKIVENPVKNFSGNVIDAITPASTSLTISSNSSCNLQNGYTTYSFFIKGRSLYNSTFNIELWLGSEETPASGVVAFDNIKMEYVSYADYSSASTGSSLAKVAFDSDPAKFNITNSTFNEVEKADKTLTYPLTPANWTHTAKDTDDIFFGVINTNTTIYDTYKNNFGGFANPGNPSTYGSTTTDTNNILLMHNVYDTYQSVKSSSFSVDNNSYYKLTFDYKVLQTATSNDLFNVYVQDENNNVLYANENIGNTIGEWKQYTLYINTKAYSHTLYLILSLGTETSEVQGIAYIDNVALVKDEDMTDETYEQIAKESNVLDFEQGNFNLVKYNKDGMYTALRYTGNLENADTTTSGLANGFGGIVDADVEPNIEKSPNSESALSYIMYIGTMNKATYSMTAKDSLALSSGSYYKFAIDIKTQGNLTNTTSTYDEKYGAVFALSGLDEKINGIVAKDWTTYTIYVACTSSVTINVQFALESLDIDTCGNAYFDNFVYEVIDEDTYNEAKRVSDTTTELFIGDTDEEEDNSSSSSSINAEYIWYVIPTLILAVALILALVSFFMKKINIKKWEKRKINEYDREKTVHRDVIRKQAEEQRDESIKNIKSSISELEQEKQRIENIHQEQLKASRANRAKGVSRNTEREFKQYAKLHTAIENRIANLNKQIDSMNSPEYLLSIQHKIMLEKAKAERLAKEKAYAKDKANRKAEKKSKKQTKNK